MFRLLGELSVSVWYQYGPKSGRGRTMEPTSAVIFLPAPQVQAPERDNPQGEKGRNADMKMYEEAAR
jgi:hypothetical protein